MLGRWFKILLPFLCIFSLFIICCVTPKQNITEETVQGKGGGREENPELWTGDVPYGIYLVPKKVHLFLLYKIGYATRCDVIVRAVFKAPEQDYGYYYCNFWFNFNLVSDAVVMAKNLVEHPLLLLENLGGGEIKKIDRHNISCFAPFRKDIFSFMDIPKGIEKPKPDFVFHGTSEELEKLKKELESQGIAVSIQ